MIKNVFLLFIIGRIYLNYYLGNYIFVGKLMKYYAEILGPTFVKMCQMLSYRDDLLPEETLQELKTLLHTCSTEKDLDKKIKEKFSSVTDLNLIGSGSIAQVYSGVIENVKYAFKVKRTNIAQRMEEEIKLLEGWLNYFDKKIPYYKIVNRFQIFKKSILIQTNFLKEIENNKLISKGTKKLENVAVVKIFEDLSNDEIIVMEYIDGIPLCEYKNITDFIVLKEIIKLWLNTLFDYCIMHGDLHYGNILVQEKKIVIIDFGLVFNIKPSVQVLFLEYLNLLVKLKSDKLYEWVLENYILGNITDTFKKELKELIYFYQKDNTMKIWDFGKDMHKLIFKYGLMMNEQFIELEVSQLTSSAVLKTLNDSPTVLKNILEELELL